MSAVPGDIVRLVDWRRINDFALGVPARPTGLAIAGEAGAGKSTLWRAAVEAAAEAGTRILRSEPSAGEIGLSFAGLSDLLVDLLPLVADSIPAPQRDALEVALLMRPAGDERPTARAVGLAVLAAVRASVAEGPLLIAIDDVHWLDEASLDALTFALRRLTTGPVSLLLAARADAPADLLTVGEPPPPRAWHDLLDAMATAERIDLGPLDARQVRQLLPDGVSMAQAHLVAEQSRGNPFWAREISASLDSAGPLLTPTARGLARRLSDSLSADAAEALTVVAAAGRIRVSDALAVLGSLPDPAGALDAAVLAGAVVETRERLTPAHPLIGAAAIEALPPGRRRSLYLRLGAAATSVERRAHFLALAAGQGPDAAVAEALDRAADAAQGRAANAAAGQFAAQAVSFTAESDEVRMVQRRIRAGELLFLSGDVEVSLEHLEHLDVDQLATPDLERALPLLLDMMDLVRSTDDAIAILAHAAEAVGPDPRRRALVFALAADVMYGLPGGRRSAALEAIRCAEAAGAAAEPALHRALINLFVAKVSAADGFDADLLERAEELEARVSISRLYDVADLKRGRWSLFVEDVDTSRVALRRCIERATEAGDDYARYTFLTYLAATEELAGDYAAARTAIDDADATAAWHRWPAPKWQLEPRCDLLIAAGDFATARAIADEQLADDDTSPMAARFIGDFVRGKISAWQGDPDAAVRNFERARWWAEQYEWTDPGVRQRLDTFLAEAYIRVGRLDDAQPISATLREIGERLDRPALIGDAARIDALAAAHNGDLDVAADAARAAVAAHESSGLRPDLVRSLLALGRIERRRKARRQARNALVRASELATEIGHRPLSAEIDREMPRVAAARSSGALTATEQRVADLVAGGATNREAATALFVSVRTIDTHVATIYRKLGVRTRTQLARLLADKPPGSAAR